MENKDLSFEHDEENKHLKVILSGAAYMTLTLLNEILNVQVSLLTQDLTYDGKEVRFLSLVSRIPGIFNLGGDLELFTRLVKAQDKDGLLSYGLLCTTLISNMIELNRRGVITVSVIQGHAYGGGLEAALSSQFIFAEKQSRMGFPESKFNLFPGMGAFTFLRHRIGPKAAVKILVSGEIHGAEHFARLGVVDKVCGRGKGEAELHRFVSKLASRHQGVSKILALESHYAPLSESEITEIVHEWTDAALANTPAGLNLMTKLYMAQKTQVDLIVNRNKIAILKLKIFDLAQSLKLRRNSRKMFNQ
jgi:DSF synthase